MRPFSIALVSLLHPSCQNDPAPIEAPAKPNFVIVLTDDQGYGDLGCYGSPDIHTPNLDRLAAEGLRFTSFYAQTVCGPSRAALMTGCYPLRVAKDRKPKEIHPFLHSGELTLAELLKREGYATGCFGKWDLAGHYQRGFAPELMPNHQGFDVFFGTPASNDQYVDLFRNGERIEEKADMNTLTRRYTDAALAFLDEHADEPFLLYVPHTMPHTILGASDEFRGTSRRGFYGDVIEELDHSVGRIVNKVEELGLRERTYIIFQSDNGPWYVRRQNGGSAGPLRGAKTSTWEGGVRVPCIVWAPGRVPAGTRCDEVATSMDWLPTLTHLAGGTLPTDRVIDGHDVGSLLHAAEGATSPTEVVYHYQHHHLQALRRGRWKLHLPRPDKIPGAPNWSHHIAPRDAIPIPEPLLYDLHEDVSEEFDLARAHPDVVEELMALAEQARTDLGDHDRPGAGVRTFD